MGGAYKERIKIGVEGPGKRTTKHSPAAFAAMIRRCELAEIGVALMAAELASMRRTGSPAAPLSDLYALPPYLDAR